jgi:hypothetical protein
MSSGTLFAQVAWLALVASISPPAMLLAGLYLRSERPGKHTLSFIIGGLVIVTVVGTVALVLIRAGGLSHLGHHHHQTRYGLRLGLGVIALAAAVFLYLRKPKQPDPSKKPKKPNLVKRLSSQPSSVTAFAVGVFMFGPSVAFISAVQVVATAKTGLGDTIAAMAMIVVLAVLFGWLPFLAYLIAPGRTLHLLHSLEGALAKHGRTILVAAVAVIGLYLTIQGITGLVLTAGVGVLTADLAARTPAQEGGERENHHRDAQAKEQNALLVVGLDRDVHEGNRRDQDQHGDDPGLEVFQVTHPQPVRQPVLVLVPFFPEHEQLIEAERGDHQGRAHQERVHHHEEDAKPAADSGRLADIEMGGPQQDVRPVDKRAHRVEHQEDDRDQRQQPRASQNPLKPLLKSARPGRFLMLEAVVRRVAHIRCIPWPGHDDAPGAISCSRGRCLGAGVWSPLGERLNAAPAER